MFRNILNENLKLNFKSKDKKYKIAYHSACSMQHGQKVHNQPMELLAKTSNEIMEIPEGHICCGSAGTYNILQTEIAKELLSKKVKNIESLKPDFISTGNIGCITQIANGTKTPILHTIEVLDWYTGGPKPKILQKKLTMKKIIITRRLLKESEDKASKIFDAKFNSNDELYSQSKLIELSEGQDAISNFFNR